MVNHCISVKFLIIFLVTFFAKTSLYADLTPTCCFTNPYYTEESKLKVKNDYNLFPDPLNVAMNYISSLWGKDSAHHFIQELDKIITNLTLF